MNKAMDELLQILAHQKAAAHHLAEAKRLSFKRYQHDIAGQLNTVQLALEGTYQSVELVYGKAARAAVRRAR